MSLRKRTQSEIEEAVGKGDATGGYSWFPWLIWMRTMYVVGFFLNLIFGIIGLVTTWPETAGILFGIMFGVIAPTIIGIALARDYKKLKKKL